MHIGFRSGIERLAARGWFELIFRRACGGRPSHQALDLVGRSLGAQPFGHEDMGPGWREHHRHRDHPRVQAATSEVAGTHAIGVVTVATAGTETVRATVMHHIPAAAVGDILIFRRQSTFRTRPLCNNCNAVSYGQSTGVRRYKNSSIVGQNEIASQPFIPILVE